MEKTLPGEKPEGLEPFVKLRFLKPEPHDLTHSLVFYMGANEDGGGVKKNVQVRVSSATAADKIDELKDLLMSLYGMGECLYVEKREKKK